MSAEISSPLLDIVNAALKQNVEGPAAKLNQRMKAAGSEVVVLCDLSGSMWDFVGRTGIAKIEHLKAALTDVLKGFPGLIIVGFASSAKKMTLGQILKASGYSLGGSTNMGGAIEYVAAHWKPRKTILITDGMADDQEHALEAVESLTGAVDTIYCGPDADPAVLFLRKLAKSAGGRHVTWDGTAELAPAIRMLALPPAPGPIQL